MGVAKCILWVHNQWIPGCCLPILGQRKERFSANEEPAPEHVVFISCFVADTVEDIFSHARCIFVSFADFQAETKKQHVAKLSGQS